MTENPTYVIHDFDYLTAKGEGVGASCDELLTEQRLTFEVKVSSTSDTVALEVKPHGYTGAAMEVLLDIHKGKPRVIIYMQSGYDPALFVNMSPRGGAKVTIDDAGPFNDEDLKEYEAFLENASRSHQAQDSAQLNPVQADESVQSKKMKL